MRQRIFAWLVAASSAVACTVTVGAGTATAGVAGVSGSWTIQSTYYPPTAPKRTLPLRQCPARRATHVLPSGGRGQSCCPKPGTGQRGRRCSPRSRPGSCSSPTCPARARPPAPQSRSPAARRWPSAGTARAGRPRRFPGPQEPACTACPAPRLGPVSRWGPTRPDRRPTPRWPRPGTAPAGRSSQRRRLAPARPR